MTKTDLLALADRVEREEPSKDLSRAVMRAVWWQISSIAHQHGEWWCAPDGILAREPPDPLHSLDAAASLVPEGWSYTVGTNEVRRFAVADLGRSYPTNARVTCENATPAAALTAAALRARAMEMTYE